jgi:hypothetical protein
MDRDIVARAVVDIPDPIRLTVTPALRTLLALRRTD